MKFLLQGLLVTTMVLSQSSFACTEDGSEGIVPEHNLRIEVDEKRNAGLTEEQFNAVIDKVETHYAPVVAQMNATLKVARNWTDGTVNAYASRSGSTWNVAMFGGLARHETITEDGFALVVCHEIGHHIGGAPKKASMWSNSWASNEGQSDYWANLKCLRQVFKNESSLRIVREMKKNKQVPEAVITACNSAWKTATDRAICVRGAMAGKSVSDLFAALRNATPGSFETPDTKVVTKTDDNHPHYQCRLDTYFQGSLCEANMNEDVEQSSEVTATCHGTLGHTTGTRPLCWFKPSVL